MNKNKIKNELINNNNTYNGCIIKYSNKLARKITKFSLEEQKSLHLIFSQVNPYQKNPTTFKISKLDFFDKLQLQSTDRYPRYRKLVHGLINKSFFEVMDEQGGQRVEVVIFDSYWKPKEPYFEVSLNPNFMPYLEQLVKDYTKIQLNSILRLKSKHTLSLYKFICSWTDERKKENQRYITTNELKELLGLKNDAYVYKGKFNRSDFEKRAVKPNIAEINEKTNIDVSFKKNKKNNKVQNYEFNWNYKIDFLLNQQKQSPRSIDLEKQQDVNLGNCTKCPGNSNTNPKTNLVAKEAANNPITKEEIDKILNEFDKW